MSFEIMNICSLSGTWVIYTGKGGYDHDKIHADKFLEVGKQYQVDYTDIGDWSTKVYLKGFPEVYFNSVMFIESKDQSMELVVEHWQVHNRGCIGNQRMKTDVMISVSNKERPQDIHDIFFTQAQAQALYEKLGVILSSNNR